MKLQSVSCTQFAGLRDANVRFDSGINVVFGKNESGKSTLVNLIARTLFQNAKLDGRTDKEFIELFFPSARKGSKVKADFADGKLTFETENGLFTLTKEWGADARCMLSTPEGVVRDAKTIDSLLRDALIYGEGVYSQLLLSSQRGADHALETLLSASKTHEGKQEIADAVTMAAAECDGVSVDAIEQAIDGKIDELLGKHWDVEADRPVRRSTRWSAGLGTILKAYYEWEDAVQILREIEALEQEADRTSSACADADQAVVRAQTAFDAFREFAALLTVCAERKDKIHRLEEELVRLKEALSKWPTLTKTLQNAKALQEEQHSAQVLKRVQAAEAYLAEQHRLESMLSQMPCPTAEDITSVRTALQRQQTLQQLLCGMNLTATVRMFNGHEVEVRSLRTGELLTFDDATAFITEAVEICVDGVMQMRLSPTDVDASAVATELQASQALVKSIFETYGVTSADELNDRAVKVADMRRMVQTVQMQLATLLGEDSLEELQATAKSCLLNVREEETILSDVRALCGGQDLVRFTAVTETLVQAYENEYGTIDSVKIRAFDVNESLEKAKASLALSEEIPEAFAAVEDPEVYLTQLQTALAEAQRQKEEALAAKTVAAGRLEGYKEGLDGDPKDKVQATYQTLAEQKDLLGHWLHIKEVFLAQKECLTANPMVELATRFARNLAIVSEEGVTTEFPDADRLQMRLYSRNHEVDFARLSEGTKETVSLSFRLAMLDHLFPNGGGVLVLDDPFANMDAERTARSCALLQECADRHQILFLTCKEEYIAMLGGRSITL